MRMRVAVAVEPSIAQTVAWRKGNRNCRKGMQLPPMSPMSTDAAHRCGSVSSVAKDFLRPLRRALAQEECDQVVEVVGRDDLAKSRRHERQRRHFARLDFRFRDGIFLA